MREWNAANREKVRQQGRDRRAKLKEQNPEKYTEVRAACNKSNNAYANRNRDYLRAKSKVRNNAIYTPEYGVAIREKYSMKYSTQTSIKSARKRATEKGQPFDLTAEWFDAEFAKGCAKTGIALDPNGSKTPFTVHVDKVIPSLGYVKSNCRLVCACYNTAKWRWTDDVVLTMAKALIARSQVE
jgi:hypothetical protein